MRRALVATLGLVLLAVPSRGAAQDIETEAALRGIQLPQGYYDRIRENPDFFEFSQFWGRRGPAGVDGAAPRVEGDFPLVVIPVLFSDSEEPLFDQGALSAVLFDGPAPNGTLTEFYQSASQGVFNVSGTVLPWVRTSLTLTQVVGSSFGLGDDAQTGTHLAEAISLNDGEIDFGLFDSDGPDGVPNSGDDDGFVDALTFEFQEVTASCGGPGIWPHRSSFAFWLGAPVVTDDAGANGGTIQINQYIIQGSTNCAGTGIQSAGVISHEFGHALGLPDLYHAIDGIQPASRRWVLGCWGLMAAGSWGCGDGSTRGDIFGPTSLSPWSRDFLGWVDWIEIGSVFNQEVELRGAIESGQALRLPLDGTDTEFLVVEYRPQTGFDAVLPEQGVLVYHWDTNGDRRPARGSGTPYMFSIEEADGRTDLKLTHGNGGNRGEGSDAWGTPGSLGPINTTSTPDTRRNDGDRPSSVSIHSIVVDGDVARVRLTTTGIPGLLDAGALPSAGHFNPYSGMLEIAGGAPPYTATLVGPSRGLVASTQDRFLVIEGAPDQLGTVSLTAEVSGFSGVSGLVNFTLEVGEFVMNTLRAVTAFISNGEIPVNAGEAQLMDAQGNQNGMYDIGDLRAFMYPGG
jgi:M6 family metalloprotease-like protein